MQPTLQQRQRTSLFRSLSWAEDPEGAQAEHRRCARPVTMHSSNGSGRGPSYSGPMMQMVLELSTLNSTPVCRWICTPVHAQTRAGTQAAALRVCQHMQ